MLGEYKQQSPQLALVVKNLPANAGLRHKRWEFDPWVGNIPLEEGMATSSSIFAWRTPWPDESGGLQLIGSQKVRHKLALSKTT